MELSTAVRLIEKGIPKTPRPQKWLDLGAGRGLFTNALAGLLGAGSMVCAVDKDQGSLDSIKVSSTAANIIKLKKDFVNATLDWEKWDGILMANALHFVPDQLSFLRIVKQNGSRLLIVEYNTDTPNPWVPYPVSFLSLKKLIQTAGFDTATFLDEEPSRFNRATIYSSAVS